MIDNTDTPAITARLVTFADAFDAAFAADLDHRLDGVPDRLADAVRHAAMAGGKRIRPFLVCQSAALFGTGQAEVLPAAIAVECIHCYSLVHDDLPAMDNDTLRRGKPTVHVAFDEATAILAGDTLLTIAFEALSGMPTGAALAGVLARAAGARGMVGGQMLDLAAEGRFGVTPEGEVETVRRLQAMKTGALIAAACELGARSAGAAQADIEALGTYARAIGFAYQIADDLLDHEGDAAAMGKAARKDAAAGKATIVSLMGSAAARDMLDDTLRDAVAALGTLPGDTRPLADFAAFIAARDR